MAQKSSRRQSLSWMPGIRSRLAILCVCGFVSSGVPGAQSRMPPPEEIRINLQAVGSIESDNNPFAVNSRTGCYGLYQISEICLRDFNQINRTQYAVDDLLDPRVNEQIASWYFDRLKGLLRRYDIPVSVTTLLASYNWGIGNVARWHRDGSEPAALPAQTREYIGKYLALTRGSLT